MSKDKIDINFIQFSTYVRPDEAVNKSSNWVLNGKNNLFYQYIIDRANGSPTNASINKTYTDLILGQGLSFKPTPGGSSKNAEDWARLKTILKDRDLKRIATDFQVFGASSFQVQTNNKNELISISHVPKQQIAPSIENEEGVIEMYWQSKDWTKPYLVENTPVPYPTFGSSKEGLEIYVIRPYTVGMTYYETPDYVSALQYAQSEEEISNMNINAIRNGLSTGFILNVKNGINLDPEDKEKFTNKVTEKLAGSENGGNFIVSFNGEENEVEVVPFPSASGVHKQWEVLNDVCASKIMTAHRVISRSIVGLEANTGFSSSADEMLVAEQQTLKRVIAPKQRYITDALEEVLSQYGINLDLYFKPLTEAPKEIVKETANVNMSSVEKKKDVVTDIELGDILERYAEDPPEGYELDSSELVSLSAIQKSEQDTDIWKIRYAYVEGTNKTRKGSSRFFCTKMRALEQAGKVYRKEDIIQMGDDGVNGQFAHEGGKYSIWLYGGGVNCYHRWERRIFKKKLQKDGKPFIGNPMQNVNSVNVNEARRQGAKIPKNAKDVAIAEIDKPNKGSLK